VLALIAIVGSMVAKSSREGREALYARARADSARRAVSVHKADSARADSVNQAALVGGMVDTTRTAEQLRKDSIARATAALQQAVVTAIRSYTNAIQRGDIAAARAAFPRVPEDELGRWAGLLQQYDLRIQVIPPNKVQLSEGNVVADADVALQVQYIDRATKSPVSTNRLLRHAQLTKQGRFWQLESFRTR